MDNSAAFSFSESSFPINSSEAVKSQAQDLDPRTQAERNRKDREHRFSCLEEQTQLANRNLDSTLDWFKVTQDAKLEVRETNREIAQTNKRLQGIQRKKKLEQFCQRLDKEEIDQLIADLDPLISRNLDVIQQLEGWRYQYK